MPSACFRQVVNLELPTGENPATEEQKRINAARALLHKMPAPPPRHPGFEKPIVGMDQRTGRGRMMLRGVANEIASYGTFFLYLQHVFFFLCWIEFEIFFRRYREIA